MKKRLGAVLSVLIAGGPAAAAWVEDTEQRSAYGITFREGAMRRFESILKTPLNYRVAGSAMAPVDFRVRGVSRASDFSGLETKGAKYDLRIGQPNGKSQGWVEIGADRNARKIGFRLAQIAFIHWPTREISDIAGAPDYDTGERSVVDSSVTLGPPGSQITRVVSSTVLWRNLWSLGGGEVYVRWVADGDSIKEEVVVTEVARAHLESLEIPFKPSETYLCLLYEMDKGDAGKFEVGEGRETKNPDGDFESADGKVAISDASDKTMIQMGADQVWSASNPDDSKTLVKRFYKANGINYLAVGLPVDVIFFMDLGDLIFDPTVTIQPDGTGGLDTYLSSSNDTTNFGTQTFMQSNINTLSSILRFDLSSIPSAALCASATISVFSITGGGGSAQTVDIRAIDPSKTGWTEDGATWTTYDGSNNWTTAGALSTTGDIIVTILASASVAAGNGTQADFVMPTATVKSWFGTTNPGIHFYQTSGDGSAWSSSDNSTASLRPKIAVVYFELNQTIDDWKTFRGIIQ